MFRNRLLRVVSSVVLLLALSFVTPAATALAATTYPIEAQYTANGPYATAAMKTVDGGLYDVFAPSSYAALGFASPIVTWGNGTYEPVTNYSTLLNHFASWGFTVVASTSTMTGDGTAITAAAQWMVAQNTTVGSPYYGDLAVNEVAAVGHSQGAGGSTRAALANPTLIKTLMTLCLPNQGDTSNTTYNPAQLTVPTFFIGTYGPLDSYIASPTYELGFFNEAPVPAALGLIKTTGGKTADHLSPINATAGGSPQGFLGYTTAWLLYQLRGDTNARLAFAGSSPELLVNTNWPGSKTKNLL